MKQKFVNALSLALIVAMLFTSVALADDISNNIDADIDATLESISLTAGGSNGGVSFYVQPRNGDSDNGCNMEGTTEKLVVSVNSSNISVATVSPSSLTFDDCGDTPGITVTPVGTGSVTISLSQTSNNTGGTFNLAPASFTVNVNPPANTAPILTLPGNQTAEATSAAGAVVTFAATATDAQDDPDPTPVCSPASGSTFPLGTTTVTCSVTDSGGMSNSGSFTVTVQDTTAPTLTLPGSLTVEGTSLAGATVTYTVTANDLVSGSIAVTCSPASGSTFGYGSTQVNCFASDAAGNTANSSFSILVQDTTAPTISGAPDRAPDSNGWYNKDVKVSFTCSDSGSGIASCAGPTTLSSDGANQSVTGTAADNAGNTASATVSGINIDKTAPTISASINPAAAGTGWYNSTTGAPTVSFSCNETGSGLVGSCPSAVTLGEGADQSVSGGPVSDVAGNTSNVATLSNIDVDLTAPSVALVGGPANGTSYYFGSVPGAPTCDASDATSGLAACNVSGHSTAVGTHTVTATAADNAGNSASTSITYTVLPWTLNGFYQPVDMGLVNVAKNGSTVPLKFKVLAGATELTNTSVINTFVQKLTCGAGVVTDDIENYATGGTSLRYDTTGGQFIFNWQTPKIAGNCYRVTVTTQDGSSISADFRLK